MSQSTCACSAGLLAPKHGSGARSMQVVPPEALGECAVVQSKPHPYTATVCCFTASYNAWHVATRMPWLLPCRMSEDYSSTINMPFSNSLGVGAVLSKAKCIPMMECTCRSVSGHAGRNGLRAACLLYTSPSPRDQRGSRMPSSA